MSKRIVTDRQSEDYKRGYANGYQTRSDRWPDHRPPAPPQPQVAALVEAAQALRDECDSLCATFDPDDDVSKRLDPRIEAVDAAMRAIFVWLREPL